ncbi:3-isopropylmalate dehydratase small subunit [Parvularcula sp. ZS-1/3]|uniref:3-isopropylmalate dehydratase n=1 Tax=Parvularcula mediterranea TaxID=2732508 RepID=A0A7Y3W5Q5_9PROT|nr:3-isopropylmalate dehydratase small subunit [Parvularcula mediterranea]NNU16869.1 3-isopropylmalate dehydratase small subunit [Parvularcula mediterranea]
MIEAFTKLTSKTIVLPQTNIDTDQIIPARFLTTTDRDGLGDFAFRDWRFDQHGNKMAHPLNARDPEAVKVIVAGDNFGCGSSREHAPWALTALGFRAVISSSFGDIFRSNALKNGLLPVQVDPVTLRLLMECDGHEVTIYLEEEELRFGNHVVPFLTEPFSRKCLLEGRDTLGVLLGAVADIEAFEADQGAF